MTPSDPTREIYRAFIDGYANGRAAPKDAREAGRDCAEKANRFLAALPTTPAPSLRSLLAELDACEPIIDGRGPGPGRDPAPTFTGWRVPDWLMQRVRAALEGAPHDPE